MSEIEVFHSFEECPPDADLPEEHADGDDAMLAFATWANPGAPLKVDSKLVAGLDRVFYSASLSPQEAARRVVPHPREIRKGSRGFDVLALQRAITKPTSPATGKHYRRWGGNTGQFGESLKRQLRAFQHDRGLQADGVYGAATHAKMASYYDAYGIRLLNLVQVRTPAEARLATLMSGAMILYNRRAVVHYTQGSSRMTIVRHRLTLAGLGSFGYFYEDCSSSTTGLYYVAGLADPNGLGFNGLGFTGTQVVHGWRVSPSAAPKGALLFYGWSFPYHHVTMAVGGGNVFSHGSEYGPRLSRWNYRGDCSTARVYGGLPS